MGPEPTGHAFDQGAEGVDGQAGLVQLRRLQRQVEGGELEEAEGVVGDHDLGRGAGQLFLHLGELGRQLLLGRLPDPAAAAARGPAPERPPPPDGDQRRPPEAGPPGEGSEGAGDSRRIGRSPSGVQSVLIGLPYVV